LEGIFNSMTLTEIIARVTRYAKRVIVTDNSSNDAVKITQTGSGNALVVEDTANDTSPFVVKSNGDVGIGKTSPSEKLDVNGTVKATSANVNAPNNIWSDTAYYSIGTDSQRLGAVYHHSSSAVSIVSNGYRNDSGTWTSFNAGGDSGAASIQLYPNGQIQFGTQATKSNGSNLFVTGRVTITSTGAVGIGTSSPTEKLHVDGSIRFDQPFDTAVGVAGAASALPALPTGYLVVNINGTDRKIPYYNP